MPDIEPRGELMVASKPQETQLDRIIEFALMSKDSDVDKLTKLFELKRAAEADEARKAYYAAMKLFKDNPPRITKNGTGHNSAKYATLDHACAQIIPALAAVGITHKWNVKAKDKKVVVSCVLSHELGYSEPDPPTMEADADTSGNKNSIQAIGSSLKYLERYTLFAASGLDDGSKDDDGKGAGGNPPPKMPDEQVAERLTWIAGCRSSSELRQTYEQACTAAESMKDRDAVAQFIKAKDQRYRELRKEGAA